MIHFCNFCKKEFSSVKKTAKFCCGSCAAKARVDILIERNKSRRKYPEIDGLTKSQIIYRHNDRVDRFRDIKIRHDLITHLGGKCVICGYDKNILGLVLDHKNGDGHQDRKEKGSKIARYYIKHLEEAHDKLQVLCATCNQIKSYEENEHNRSRRIIETNHG